MPITSEPPDFMRWQYALAGHIRNPSEHPAPEGMDDLRMKIYRDLFFNNVRNLLANTFPVLRQILGEDAWRNLTRDYFARHLAHTPLFPQMPREFLRYLEQEREGSDDDPPFLQELAHYEWVELALSIDPREIPDSGAEPGADLLATRPVLSPLAWPLTYRFPVHRLSQDFQPQSPPEQPTYLLVYRDRGDQVHFLELNPVSALLLQKLGEEDASLNGRQILEQIAEALQHPNPEVVIQGGLRVLHDFQQRDVILGG